MKNFLSKLKMPSAFTMLFGIIVVMAALTWFVPAGQYEMDDEDAPIAGTYEAAEQNPQGFWEIIQAPIAGFLDASDVVIFVLVIGGFLAVQMKTGALNAGFGRIIKKLKGRESWLIPILMIFFAIGGTTYGMQEETIAFYPLVIPIIMAAGYNALTAVMVIVLGAGVGVLGSTVNPFATGIASGFANISIGDGIIERLIILVISLVAAIWFTMRYAKKVKNGEIVEKQNALDAETFPKAAAENTKVPELTGKRQAALWVFSLTFIIMILAVIPWADKFNITLFADLAEFLASIPIIGPILGHTPPFGDWWFGELAGLFLLSAIITYAIDRMGEQTFVDTFMSGAKDLLAVALIIGIARGITVIMNDGNITATIIHAGEELLAAMPSGLFAGLAFIVFLPLSFLVPSTSGLATLSMPVIAPIADFVGVDRSIVVTAYQSAAGVVNMIAPTVGSLMGGLALAKVSYGLYVKRTWKLFVGLSIISIAVVSIAAIL